MNHPYLLCKPKPFIKAESRRKTAQRRTIPYQLRRERETPRKQSESRSKEFAVPMMAASSKSYYSRTNYRFLSSDHQHHETHGHHDSSFELDESDLYNSASTRSSDSPEFLNSRVAKRPSANKRGDSGVGGTAASLPVNIPDWSKILREEYRDNRRRSESDDDDVEGDHDWYDQGGVRVPPHEFLARQMARTRIASFSVHEGIGRTLKGRDLRMVRNAIFEKTGFQD